MTDRVTIHAGMERIVETEAAGVRMADGSDARPPRQLAHPAAGGGAASQQPAERAHTTSATAAGLQPRETVAMPTSQPTTWHSMPGRTSKLDTSRERLAEILARRTRCTRPQSL